MKTPMLVFLLNKVEYYKILQNSSFIEQFRWLFLKKVSCLSKSFLTDVYLGLCQTSVLEIFTSTSTLSNFLAILLFLIF